MKRFLVVLTILALAAGFAFAAISGSVTASYDFYFNDGNVAMGYTPSDSEIEATFSLDSQKGGLTGENKPYVVVAISASISGQYSRFADVYYDGIAKTVIVSGVSLDTFKIVGEDWELNLLKADGAKTDFAVSAIDSWKFFGNTRSENVAKFSYSNNVNYTKGVSLTYKGYVVGVGFNTADLADFVADITLEAKTPEYTFGDVKVQAGAGFSQEEADDGAVRKYGVSAKAAYDADVKASVAIDAGKIDDGEIAFDLAANLQVAPVTADLYYANKDTTATSSKKSYYTDDDYTKGVKPSKKLENLLSAKVVVNLGDVIEDVPVKLTFTGKDLLKKNDGYTNWSVAANTTALKDFDITVTAGHVEDAELFNLGSEVIYTGIENIELDATATYYFDAKVIELGLDATYTAEKYTAECGVEIATDFENSFVAFGASVESDKLVDGATLKAELGGLDFGELYALDVTYLSLSCTVEF